MKFTKWIKSRREDGPAKAMITTVRVEFDFTPEDVAMQLLYAVLFEDEGPDEGADPNEVYDWVAGLSQKRAAELVKWAVRDMGASDYIYMYVGERYPDDSLVAATEAVVTRFVEKDTIDRLFGEDAA